MSQNVATQNVAEEVKVVVLGDALAPAVDTAKPASKYAEKKKHRKEQQTTTTDTNNSSEKSDQVVPMRERTIVEQMSTGLNLLIAIRAAGDDTNTIKTKMELVRMMLNSAYRENWEPAKTASYLRVLLGNTISDNLLSIQKLMGYKYIPFSSLYHQIRNLVDIIEPLLEGKYSAFLPKELVDELAVRSARLSEFMNADKIPASEESLKKLISAKS